MARIFLFEEIRNKSNNAIRMLRKGLAHGTQTERTIDSMIREGQTPADIESYGTERYQELGHIIAQAISELNDLGANDTTGLPFPSVVDIESPIECGLCSIGNTETGTVGKGLSANGDRLVVWAKPRNDGLTPPNPFVNISAGQRVIIQQNDVDEEVDGIKGSITGFIADVLEVGQMTADGVDFLGDSLYDELTFGTDFWFLVLDTDMQNNYTLVDNFKDTNSTKSNLDRVCQQLRMREIDDGV